jgi:hypothetical protein
MGQGRGIHGSMQRSQKVCGQLFMITACVCGGAHKHDSRRSARQR